MNIFFILSTIFALILTFLIPFHDSSIKFGPEIKIYSKDVKLASENIPFSEANYIKGKHESLEDAQKRVAFLRMVNPICSQCGWKPSYEKIKSNDFIICKKCICTQYCSSKCMKKHRDIHSIWCCNLNSERDYGLQKLVNITKDEEFDLESDFAYKKWLGLNGIRPSTIKKCIFDFSSIKI